MLPEYLESQAKEKMKVKQSKQHQSLQMCFTVNLIQKFQFHVIEEVIIAFYPSIYSAQYAKWKAKD